MNPLLNSKYGCWVVDRKIFLSKIQALEHASRNKSLSVSFYYHNHIWENFDRTLLGKTPLKTLYKQRAQQLRDQYDHLVLHYSGGSDSHNILHTFLSNNIQLDEISVRWAKPLIDGKFYSPNNIDTSASNAPSEWDYTIKPALEKIRSEHPTIKITIVDFTENYGSIDFSEKSIEQVLLNSGMTVGALGSVAQRIDSKLELMSSSTTENKKIGHIFGVEKPMLSAYNGNINMIFQDSMLEVAVLGDTMKKNSAEMFYWTPDLPLLPMEQAYQSSLFFKNKSDLLYKIGSSEYEEMQSLTGRLKLHNQILYAESWDNTKFQVSKPNSTRSDWWSWIHKSSELNIFQQSFNHFMKNVTADINQQYLNCSGNVPILSPIKSKPFHILSLT